MNAFADSLFSLCFGWLRSLVQGIWTGIVSGDFSGFFTWLGDNWLWLALFLVASATVLDFLIWMIRWRPYLVWRTKWRRFVRRLRRKQAPQEGSFSQGYQDGPDLGLPPVDAPVIDAWMDSPYDPTCAPAAAFDPAYDPDAWAAAPQHPLRPGENEDFAPPAAASYDAAEEMPPFEAELSPRRRRRSDRYAAAGLPENAQNAPPEEAETLRYAPAASVQPVPENGAAWRRTGQQNEEWTDNHE